jgi:hypothetical protein
MQEAGGTWKRSGRADAAACALALVGLIAPQSAGAAAAKAVSAEAATVSELLVTASVKCLQPDRSDDHAERPRVIDSYPKKGSLVRPGIVVVRVTFNRPMACDGAFAQDMSLANPCPGQHREMLLSYDRRTFRTVCAVNPGTEYGVVLSQDPTVNSFMGLAGLPSMPYRLTFTTSTGVPVTTVCEAMLLDEVTARQLRAAGKDDCSIAPGS